jgi:hypothetical protein
MSLALNQEYLLYDIFMVVCIMLQILQYIGSLNIFFLALPPVLTF